MSTYQRKGEQPLYAPAAPFARAIEQWAHDRQKDRVVIARRAGIPDRSLRAYCTGERTLITLAYADRLSIALGVPLPCLAEEFLPRGKALERWCREKATA